MRTRLGSLGRTWIAAILGLVLAGNAVFGQEKKERDIFDYDAQKAAKDVKRIVFVADTDPHGGRGNHEFLAGAIYLARTINARYPEAYAVVHTKRKWPKDLKHADTIIVLLNHGGSAVNPAVKEAMARGAGFMAIHYGVEVNRGKPIGESDKAAVKVAIEKFQQVCKGNDKDALEQALKDLATASQNLAKQTQQSVGQGDHYLKWMGGYFEPFWSVNPWWVPEFKDLPKHEVTRGVKPFAIRDEWYYHMRFVDDMKGVTPILAAVPPLNTVQGDGKKSSSHGGNPDVYKAVSEGKAQVMAWAYERPDNGRGFGFTGLHNHANLGDDNFRTLLLNAVAWVSKLPVPEGGVASKTLSRDDLEQLIEEKLAAMKRGL